MKGKTPMRHAGIAAAAVLTIGLAGCQDFRQAAGFERIEPDEFAISTKAALIIPPDYNLKPPVPGAAPSNSLEPGDAAQAALFGTAAGTPITGTHGQLSVPEQDLLQKAGAGGANGEIRARIAADNRNMQLADQSFTNQLLFGLAGPANNADRPVDADAEKAKLDAKAEGLPAPRPAAQKPDTIRKSPSSSNNGGWFGGLFDDVF